jgi:hypothetical protein
VNIGQTPKVPRSKRVRGSHLLTFSIYAIPVSGRGFYEG